MEFEISNHPQTPRTSKPPDEATVVVQLLADSNANMRIIMNDERRRIVQLSREILLKGPCTDEDVETMKNVAKNTAVPVPRIHKAMRSAHGLFVLMDFVQGKALSEVWPNLSDSDKRGLISRICHHLKQLRTIPQPERMHSKICSVLGTGVIDGALGQRKALDPFDSIQAFEDFLCEHKVLREFSYFWDPEHPDYEPRERKVVLTHGDISPRNIIVLDDGSPSFLDWEFGGWRPDYWEYVKWHFADFPELPGWTAMMDEVTLKGEFGPEF